MSTAHDGANPGARRRRRPDPELIFALEDAMEDALESFSREQVLECILSVLPDGDGPPGSPEPGLHGRVEKVSVSLPRELSDTIRARTGAGGFSRYIAEALQDRIRHDLLGELLDALEAEHGPIGEAGVREAMQEWPDCENE